MAVIEPEDRYLSHYGNAENLLSFAQGWAEQRDETDEDAEASFLAAAQVHATLALATAVDRFMHSYNGWKDLGK